jgi:hypothetical protein
MLPSGERVVSLVGMPKPFLELQQLDVKGVADEIIAKI